MKRHNVVGRLPANPLGHAGILYVLRTGCQWNGATAQDVACDRYFRRWRCAGVFKKIWIRRTRGAIAFGGS
ncbi:MAG: hypothetical protein C4334_13915 [Pyrinomonas sp.]|uniref:transposase n=1 Tax=Pyrinomonas sp. TaxID=2080306 RepID=UPI0033337CCD